MMPNPINMAVLAAIVDHPMEVASGSYGASRNSLAHVAEVYGKHVLQLACAAAQSANVTVEFTPDAPSSIQGVRDYMASHKIDGRPVLPVLSKFSNGTVFGPHLDGTLFNLAWRTWHDLCHIKLGTGTDAVGEFITLNYQLSELKRHMLAAGVDESTVLAVTQLAYMDTLGQTAYWLTHGDFVPDGQQGEYVLMWLNVGLRRGLHMKPTGKDY